MECSGCDLVEKVPGKVSGRPVVKGTRVLAETIEAYYGRGASVEEIREDFPTLAEGTVLRMIEYVKARYVPVA